MWKNPQGRCGGQGEHPDPKRLICRLGTCLCKVFHYIRELTAAPELEQMDGYARSDIVTATVIVTDVTLDKRHCSRIYCGTVASRFISSFCIHYQRRRYTANVDRVYKNLARSIALHESFNPIAP